MERGDVEVTHQSDGKPQEVSEAVGTIQQLDCKGDLEDGAGSPTCRPSSPCTGPDSSVDCDPDAGCDHESGSPGHGPSSVAVDSALPCDNVKNCDVSSEQETSSVPEESVRSAEEELECVGEPANSSVNIEHDVCEDTPGNDKEEVDDVEKLDSVKGPMLDTLIPDTGDKQGDRNERIDVVPGGNVEDDMKCKQPDTVQSDCGDNSESEHEEDGQIERSDSGVQSEVDDTVQTEEGLENNTAPDSTDTGDLLTREDEGKSANEEDPEPTKHPLETANECQSIHAQHDSTQKKMTGESQRRSPVLNDSRTALNDDHGELDYDEDDDKEDDGADQSVGDKGDMDSEKEEGEADDDDDDEDGELGDKSDDGEIDEDDCEEGEIKDGEIRKPLQRHLCRFYNRGHCTWGSNCRFLHPGVNDKGNYSMLERPGFNHNRFNRPPGRQWNGPEATPDAAAPPPEELPPPPPEEPRQESAWERGLRQAKELMKKASQKKELETNIEEKRMNLSLNDFQEDKKFNDPYYDDILDDPYYGNNVEPVNNARPQPYENFEVHWSREPDYHFKEREPSFERPRHLRNHRLRVSPSPDSRVRRKQRESREEVPVRDGSAPVKSSVKGDEWHDPWQRTNKDQKVKKKGRSRSGSRGRRRGRSSSYSSWSSRSSSRSSFSSYSSRSSYSRSSSSYSSRSSASRSPSPSQRRKVAAKRPLQTKPSEPPRSTVLVKAAPPPANVKPLDKRRLGDSISKPVDKPPGKGPVKGPASTRSSAVSQKGPSVAKPTSATKQAMPSAGRTQSTTAKASVPAGNGKPSAPGKPSKPISPTKAPKQTSAGDRGRPGTKQLRKRRSPSSSGSSKSGSSSSRSRSRSSSASSFSSFTGSSSDSADSDDLYGDIAPVKRKSRKTVDKSKKPVPPPSQPSAPPVDSTAKPDKPEAAKPPKTKERQPGVKVTTKGTSAPSASQPATMKAKDPLKVQGQKSAIKLTLISKPTPAQIMSKKRGAVEEAFQQPAAKKQAVSAKPERDQKNVKENTSKPTKSAATAAKQPEKVAVKRPASPSAKAVKTAPVQNKVAMANVSKKSTSSRREELLKQLKAVEDAIARKRSKLT